MGVLTGGPATIEFEKQYEGFIQSRNQARDLFLASRFEMLEDAWRESSTELDFDPWLINTPGLHRESLDQHFWAHTEPYRAAGDEGLWNSLFSEGFSGDGRQNFVRAFNTLLESKGMRVRLGDNFVQMYFIDVSSYKPR